MRCGGEGPTRVGGERERIASGMLYILCRVACLSRG